MKLQKVVSGFQTGADIAGIKAAYSCNIPTGGFIPKGFKTLAGPKPEYAKKYGAVEHVSSGYKERTWDNVQQTDATFRFAKNFLSPGEKCTLNAIKNWNKPYLDFHIAHGTDLTCDKLTNHHDIVLYAGDWLDVHGVKILNIAGNAESTCPGIEMIVWDFLEELFTNVCNFQV